jgi:hypothetical protein
VNGWVGREEKEEEKKSVDSRGQSRVFMFFTA